MLLCGSFDYLLNLFSQAHGGDPRIVIGDDLPGVAIEQELREVPGHLLDHIVLRVVQSVGVVSQVLINLASAWPVNLRFFEKRELCFKFVDDQLFDV